MTSLYTEIGFGVAKDRWRALRRRVADGEDPLQEIREARRAPTMKELAEKYRALESYPQNSLGKRYCEFIRGNGFQFQRAATGSPGFSPKIGYASEKPNNETVGQSASNYIVRQG